MPLPRLLQLFTMPATLPRMSSHTEILRLKKSGLSHREIGSLLGISGARVGYILKSVRRKQCNRPEVIAFRKAAKGANGLDLVAPVPLLADALAFGLPVAESITAYLSDNGKDSATLRQIMGMFIPESDVSWRALPVHFLNDMRESAYMMTLEHLSHVDLGGAFEQEWTRRKKALMECEEVRRKLVPYLPKVRRLAAAIG